MAERMVKANGIDIWTEDVGNPDGIPILLVMGASAQAILWEGGFIAGLVDGGRYVIRFDNRDTGQTTSFDLEKETYGLALMDEVNRSEKLRGISTPTLVIHGTEDPILPYLHGEATAEAIEGARMVTLDRVGHELPEVIWPQVWEEILAHTAE